MVIDDLDPFGATAPNEANVPLIIDPDAVLPATFSLQRLKAIARRGPQIRKPGRRVQHVELAQGHGSDGLEHGNGFAPIKRLGALVVERPDHRGQI